MQPNYKINNQYYYNNRPVSTKKYEEWMKFIDRFESLTGRNFRMPTLDEWDFAARGGIYSKGYKYSGSNVIDEVAYYKGNTIKELVLKGLYQIKRKKPNELGLYDMSGGVGEFTSTHPDDEDSPMLMFFQAFPDFELPMKGGRLQRGGSYFSSDEECSLHHEVSVAIHAGARLVMEH